MEVTICIPLDTPQSILDKLTEEYPDVWEDEGWDNHRRFFIGKNSDDVDEDDPESIEIAESFLDYDGCIEACGFCEGLITGSNCLIENNGPWAQGMLSRRDFSNYKVSSKEKKEYKRKSKLWHDANQRGKDAALQIPS